jgi:hypothetical protein
MWLYIFVPAAILTGALVAGIVVLFLRGYFTASGEPVYKKIVEKMEKEDETKDSGGSVIYTGL